MYGNSQGQSLLDNMDTMKRDIKKLTSEVEVQRNKMEQQGRKIISLEGHEGQLIPNSDSYLQIRRRLLETYQSSRFAVLARNTINFVDLNKLQARSEFHWL